jgi:hypothetical protein
MLLKGIIRDRGSDRDRTMRYMRSMRGDRDRDSQMISPDPRASWLEPTFQIRPKLRSGQSGCSM